MSDLRSDGGTQIQSVLRQPRRFGLLVYLALASREAPVRRDTVLGMFWADKPQDKARNALNQAIHYLRRSLGDDAILTTGETIGLNPEMVSSDVADFLAACDAAEQEVALDLYGGTLMPGYCDSSESADFEHWLEAMREELACKANGCAWELAESAAEAGESPDALTWARRAAQVSTHDEVTARRLMKFMSKLGDRTGALQTYETLAADLAVLDLQPAPETVVLLEDLKGEWTREDTGAAGVQASEVGLPDEEATGTAKAQQGTAVVSAGVSEGVALSRRGRLGAMTLVVVALLAVLWGVSRSDATSSDATSSEATIVVMPLDAQSSLPIAAGALTNQIVRYLGQTTALNVVDGTSNTSSQLTPAGFMVRGGLIRLGDSLIANVQLLDAKSGHVLATTEFARSEPDSMATVDELGRAIAYFTQRSVGVVLEERRIEDARVPSSAKTLVNLGRSDMVTADSLISDGLFNTGRMGIQEADSLFAQAATLAPHWDEPWLERARAAEDLTGLTPLMTTKEASLTRERQIDEQGIQFCDEALKRDPKHVDALEEKAMLTWRLWLLDQPDPMDKHAPLVREAEREAREVTTISPYRARSWALLGSILIQQGEWNDAYWALKRAMSTNTYMRNDIEIVSGLFTAAWESHNQNGARDWCRVLQDRLGTSWPSAYCMMTLAATDTSGMDTTRIRQLHRALASEPAWQQTKAEFDALAAVLYARDGYLGEAREILKARPTGVNTADLPYLQAWAWLEVGNPHRAQELLKRYVAASPAARNGILRSRRFTSLTKPSRN